MGDEAVKLGRSALVLLIVLGFEAGAVEEGAWGALLASCDGGGCGKGGEDMTGPVLRPKVWGSFHGVSANPSCRYFVAFWIEDVVVSTSTGAGTGAGMVACNGGSA